jgi:hypothetical protein
MSFLIISTRSIVSDERITAKCSPHAIPIATPLEMLVIIGAVLAALGGTTWYFTTP